MLLNDELIKKIETKKTVRSRVRLLARLYLAFCDEYSNQSEVRLGQMLENAGDMYRREVISILGRAINNMCDSPDVNVVDIQNASIETPKNPTSITGQKSGLKISILNLLKLTSKFLIGYFLMRNEDSRADKVKDFVTVLKLFEEELFGDAYYDLNHRKNVKDRKPIALPKEDDVQMLMKECISIMSSTDVFDYTANAYVSIRSATATYLIIFNARRGGEPVRLDINQWKETLRGDWVDREDTPKEGNIFCDLSNWQRSKPFSSCNVSGRES